MRAIACALIVAVIFPIQSRRAGAEAALYFSQNANGGWTYGLAYNEKTGMEADQKALEKCIEGGGQQCLLKGSIFSRECIALAVQVDANGVTSSRAPTEDGARRRAMSLCRKMGAACQIQASVCDTVKEVTLICRKPVFKEEWHLKQTINGDAQKTEEVAQAINYLRSTYCRTVEGGLPDPDDTENVTEVCWQYTGIFRGERVYWGNCGD